jgi:hypothetical protein
MPMRVGRPVKIKATADTDESVTNTFDVPRITEEHHISAARALCRIHKWTGLSFTTETIIGNRDMKHIEQVNTWVS